MTTEEIRKELSLIRSMIEKARRETAESGQFFIWIGLFCMIAVPVMSKLETLGRGGLAIPALIVIAIVCGVIGYFTVNRRLSRAGAKSYPSTVCYSVWFACSVPIIIVTFVLPALNVYAWNLVPVFSSLFMGVGLFSSGVIFESMAIVWCSLAWWSGAVAVAFIHGTPRLLIVIAMIFIGWVLPGLVLHVRYRKRSFENES